MAVARGLIAFGRALERLEADASAPPRNERGRSDGCLSAGPATDARLGPPAGPSTAQRAAALGPDPRRVQSVSLEIWSGAILALIAGLGLLRGLISISHPLALLMAATILAAAVEPLVAWLNRYLPRTLAIFLVYLCGVVVLALLAWIVVPNVVAEVTMVIASAPIWINRAAELFGRVQNWQGSALQPILTNLEGAISSLATQLIALPVLIIQSTADFFFVIVTSIYWSIATPGLKRFTLSLVPLDRREAADEILGAVGRKMGGYIRGVAIDATVIGVAAYVGLLVLGVPYPLALGVIAGLGELVPLVGATIGSIPALLVALLQSPQLALYTLVFIIVLQQAENHLLVPNVMRSQARIPPVLSIMALLAGATLGGILGALIAIPLAGALEVLALRVAAPLVRRWTGAPEVKVDEA